MKCSCFLIQVIQLLSLTSKRPDFFLPYLLLQSKFDKVELVVIHRNFKKKLCIKLSRSAFFECEKCIPFMSDTTLHFTSPHSATHTQHNSIPQAQWFLRIYITKPHNRIIAKFYVCGHFLVLFNARPPKSQVLFSESGNTPLLWAFDKLTGPPGCIKSYINTKNLYFESPSSFVLFKALLNS